MALQEVVAGADAMRALIGTTVGPTRWVRVDQELIDRFSDVSGDRFWIHIDPERAATESPFGTTVAFGDLTLVLLNGLRAELFDFRDIVMGLNYGWDRVRFPGPVPVDSNVRMTAEVRSVDDLDEGWVHVVTRLTAYREGEDKPVCIADSVTRLQFTPPPLDRKSLAGSVDRSTVR